MPEYDRKDGGKINTDYRGSDRVHVSEDGDIFSSDNPFGDDTPDGVYEREDGGVVDTRYRGENVHLGGDNTGFVSPSADDDTGDTDDE